MTTSPAASDSDIYYDPYSTEIDADPYPVWRRMRDEAPLYYNEKYDFYAVTRFDDVCAVLGDPKTFSSARGSLLELIKMDFKSPGSIIFEDPPEHDLHRGILTRLFRPRDIAALTPKVREFCTEYLDKQADAKSFDLVQEFGVQVPMRAIFLLLGVPEADQARLREAIDEGLKPDENGHARLVDPAELGRRQSEMYAEYLDWRAENPSDDVMTRLLTSEFTDVDGTVRTLTREEVLNYVNLLAAAGNETTTRLIGWAGKVLAENPDQRAALVDDPSLIPNAVEELLRYESPSPANARYVTADVEFHGQTVPAGSAMLAINASANRDERRFDEPDRFDVHRKIDKHVGFGTGIHFCLGASLARLEGRIALEELLKRFPTWEVDWDNAVQAHTSTVRGWEKLPVVLP